jgi:hypothetical protein
MDVLSNKSPTMILIIIEKGTCVLLDVAVHGARNVIKIEAEKILKDKDLITEIQRRWNVKAKVIPVMMIAIGTFSKPLRQYLSNIPGEQELNELQ